MFLLCTKLNVHHVLCVENVMFNLCLKTGGIVKQGIAGSVGMLSCLVASTSWVQPPAVTISPVCSNEKLPTSPSQDTNHSSAVCATASSDDESTPLVSDMSSPQSDHLQSNTER